MYIYLFSFLVFLLCLILLILPYKIWKTLDKIDKSALRINTFDGRWSPYHPSVLFFNEGWNGWKYWMAETPYSLRTTPYGDKDECPSIHVSNDGVNWTEVSGFKNPLESLSQRQVNELDYFSDPCLLIGPEGRLECWYRLTERRGEKEFRSKVSLRRRWSLNGIDWSPVEIIAQLDQNISGKGIGKVVVSPALLYDDENGYRMWYVNMETAGCPDFQGVAYSQSKDGLHWSDAVDIKFNEPVHQWHIDLKQIDGIYFMTIFNFEDVSIWTSEDGLNFNYQCTPAVPNRKPFSIHEGLYKSSLIKDDEGYKLYVGSNDTVDTHLSLMEGPDIKSMQYYLTDSLGLSNFLSRYIFYQRRRMKCIFNSIRMSLSHKTK